jgi:gamma-glutamyltranspeptidase / glutathione hydrolase
MPVRPAVAAGHPATADAGAEILDAGGTAADAAVAATAAACVAETIMTGLLGGGHAIYWDAASGEAWNLDCFCDVPTGQGDDMLQMPVPFGEELVHYAIGAPSCAVPGVPAGLGALHERHGRLPWRDVLEPAMRLARTGVEFTPAHAKCLAMLAPVMTLDRGGEIFSPNGKLLEAGERLSQPSLEKALALLAGEGARSAYEGSLAEALLVLMRARGGVITRDDLRTYEARWTEPVELRYADHRVLTRGGLSGVPELLEALPALRGLDDTERVLTLVPVLEGRERVTHTTNVSVVDAEGNACVFTTSLGLGSGDYVAGLDLHLNSMLGEADLLVRGPSAPGARMESMMAPTLVFDADGLSVAIGSAGGTRLRAALALVLAAILDEGVDPQLAVDRPRFHPTGETVNAEPGVDEEALAELERQGRHVRRWAASHHYFGGVSLVSRFGSAADPRRSGAVRAAPSARSSPRST